MLHSLQVLPSFKMSCNRFNPRHVPMFQVRHTEFLISMWTKLKQNWPAVRRKLTINEVSYHLISYNALIKNTYKAPLTEHKYAMTYQRQFECRIHRLRQFKEKKTYTWHEILSLVGKIQHETHAVNFHCYKCFPFPKPGWNMYKAECCWKFSA